MHSLRVIDHITVEEYLEGERETDIRHEYVYGEVHAMAGGSMPHNVITGNIARAIGNAAETTPCRTYTSDMKLRVDEAVFYYPDVMLVCKSAADEYYETDPCVIVEVLSKTTSRTDLSEKRFVYTELTPLQLYLVVDSRKRKITGYYRAEDGWAERKFSKEDLIDIPCVNTQLTFEQIYAKSDR
ncbi:MAG: Uma2 family endonuclease [Deinococcota bacterium]